MNIEKLEIRGFGKFKNLTVDFTKGFNLVFGNNESGKSTIQSFIKAMLFGLKGGRAGKDGTLPQLKKFKPWSAEEYSGVMEYGLDNGQVYRIGRNFDSNSVRIFDSLFNDITGEFEISRERGAQFAEKHLGMNEASFERTVFIRQMETKIDGDQSRELIHRLSNASQTGLEEVSLVKAQEALKEALKVYVGNDKTSTRPLDKVNLRVQELKAQRVTLVERRSSLFHVEQELNQSINLRNSLESKKNLFVILKEIVEFRKHCVRMKEPLLEFSGLAEYYKKLQRETGDKEKELRKIEGELESLRAFSRLEDHVGDTLVELKKALEGLKSEMGRNSLESLTRLISKAHRQEKYYKGLAYAAAGVSALSLMIGVLKYIPLTFAAVPCIVVLVFLFLKANNIQKNLRNLENEKRTAFIKLNSIVEQVKNKEIQIEHILKTAGAKSVEDFLKLKGVYDVAVQRFDRLNFEFNRLEDESVQAFKKLESLLVLLEERIQTAALGETRLESGADDWEEVVGKTRQKLDELEDQLKDRVKKLPEYSTEMGYTESELLNGNIANIERMLDRDSAELNREMGEVLLKIKEYKTILKTEDGDTEELQKIEEEMESLSERKKRLEEIDFSLKTAYEVLTEAGMEIQRDFAPALNVRIGQIIEKITCGSYKDIRVDDNLTIKVAAPATSDIVAASSLSGGTIDQLYLALRLGMADVVDNGREKLPLIMDEIFAQYDDARMAETLLFFKQLAQDRQIILFTCKQQEVEIIKGIFANTVNILQLNG